MKSNKGNSIISVIISILILLLICLIGYEILYVDIFDIMGEKSYVQNMTNTNSYKYPNRVQYENTGDNTESTESIIENNNLRRK